MYKQSESITFTFLVLALITFVAGIYVVDNFDDKNKTYAIEQYKEGKAMLYIDGNPVSDTFDVNGINLNNYTVEMEDDKVYLMRKRSS